MKARAPDLIILCWVGTMMLRGLPILDYCISEQSSDYLKVYLVGSSSLQAWHIVYHNSDNARRSSSSPCHPYIAPTTVASSSLLGIRLHAYNG